MMTKCCQCKRFMKKTHRVQKYCKPCAEVRQKEQIKAWKEQDRKVTPRCPYCNCIRRPSAGKEH